MIEIVEVTNADGEIVDAARLAQAESVHRQLRPDLPQDYAVKMRRVFAGGGRMSVGLVNGAVRGVAVYRAYENTAEGRKFYVDDLVTDETARSTGIGHALLEHLQDKARALRCEQFTLDSGTQRLQAHKFYFREGMIISSFAFKKPL